MSLTLSAIERDRTGHELVTAAHNAYYHTVNWRGTPVARIGKGILHFMLYIEPDAPRGSVYVLDQMLRDNGITEWEIVDEGATIGLMVYKKLDERSRPVNQESERYGFPVGPLFHSAMGRDRWALRSPEGTPEDFDYSMDQANYCLNLMGVIRDGWKS